MASRGTILVADDNEGIVDFFVELLKDEGYSVSGDRNGETATIELRQCPRDLALIGSLPSHSQLDLIRAAQAVGTPIVIITTNLPPAEVLKAEGFAACLLESFDYLPKPFDIDEVLTCVARHIRTDRAAPVSEA
jgi:DNA-binding response OmpR family regulator